MTGRPTSSGSRRGRRRSARVLCLGLDPDPAALPAGFSRGPRRGRAVRDLLARGGRPVRRGGQAEPRLLRGASASAGLAALERIRAGIPADVPVVADAKRGDIGSTAARQAVALFDGLGADAVTVNPYLGGEAIAPLLERTDRFAYVLCRTSNPGAGELQDLVVAADPAIGAPAEPLHRRVARRAAAWGPGGTVGLVVGATAPAELAAIRAIGPGSRVPRARASAPRAARSGRSSQHGRATDGTGRRRRAGGGLLVNVSRGIASAASRAVERAVRATPASGVAAAARDWARRLPVLP